MAAKLLHFRAYVGKRPRNNQHNLSVSPKRLYMKAIQGLLILPLFLSWQVVQTQMGIRTGFAARQSTGFELVNEFNQTRQVPDPDAGLEYSIDYWFRLPRVRLEFLPELQFSRYRVALLENPRMEINQYSFLFNLLFYPFDWNNDCDCPTFSKEGNWLTRGLYFSLSPGISLLDEKSLISDLLPEQSLLFTAGVGMGIDFGLFEWITLSPEAGLRYMPGFPFEHLVRQADTGRGFQMESAQQALIQFSAGLRLRFRLDQR